MSGKIIPVILCGGAGSRLWPASRETFPKQLSSFGGEKSLLQETLLRVTGERFERPIIVTSNAHRFLVAEQIRALGIDTDIILEPMRRDSCAAIAVAAAHASLRPVDPKDGESALLVLAADHAIPDVEAFLDHVSAGVAAAQAGHIVTFGIKPSFAATGYGYIKPGAATQHGQRVREVAAFVEKPDAPTAEHYLAEGYLWNSGNFLFRPSIFLSELAALQPEIHGPALDAAKGAIADLDFLRLDEAAFARSKAMSVDYAVMQDTKRAAVVVSDFVWSDIGSWSAVWELSPKDAQGNFAKGDVVLHGSRNSYVHSPDVLAAVLGLEDVVVVTTRDAVLVASRHQTEEVKSLVATLSKAGRREAAEHLRHYRPWGDYEQIDRGARYQVKRITVRPGGKLSLQSHRFRSEHWVVVTGMARVTVDDTIRDLGPDQSIYIPLGAKHRLENPGDVPLELIEVQSGSYLGEDDIVRYEDVYNRS